MPTYERDDKEKSTREHSTRQARTHKTERSIHKRGKVPS